MLKVGHDTRERIINAAISLLWQQSYQGTSVDMLCARAEVKKGSFYHFFRSKKELAIAAIEAAWIHTQANVFSPVFENEDEVLDQLQALIDKVDEVQYATLEISGFYLGCPFGNLGQEMATKDVLIRQTTQKVYVEHCIHISKALQRAQDRGEIPIGDSNQKAISIFALFEGALLLAKVANEPSIFRSATKPIRAIALSEV